MKIVDRVFGWLLVLGGVLHTVGATVGLKGTPGALVWPLAGSVAAFLVAALNLMRVNRPRDRTLAWVSAGAPLRGSPSRSGSARVSAISSIHEGCIT